VERAHLTLQDRLVKELRLRGISTVAAANAYAPSFIAAYNARFAKRVQVKRADVTHARLAVLLKIMKDHMSDAEFVNLLRQHGFVSLPKAVQDKIRGNGP
jgi:hypothetical protein